MKHKIFRTIFACAMAVMLPITVAYAADVEVTVSETEITASSSADTISFDIYLACEYDFSTSDYYLRTTGDGLTFQSFELNDVSGSKSQVDLTELFDYQVMGFYTTGDGYPTGTTYNIGTVTYEYTGDDDCTISLYKAVVTSWDENREYLISHSPEEFFTITVERSSSSSSGGSSSGGSSSSGGIGTGAYDTDDDDDADVSDFPFIDVFESDWYYEVIKEAYEEGLMVGTSDNTFEPKISTTRAMMVQVLYNLAGQPDVDDVTGDEWYAKARAWAVETGVSDGTNMTDNVTREQMVAMIYRYASLNDMDISAVGDLTAFSDYEGITEYAVESVEWAVGAGIIHGNDDGTLNPQGNATRAEIATVMVYFTNLFL